MVRRRLFDIASRTIATLVKGEMAAGEHEVPWKRTTAGGAIAPAGVYFYSSGPKAGRARARDTHIDHGLRAELNEGENVSIWDGRDGAGHAVGAGVYLFRLRVDEEVFIQKSIVMR